MRIEWLLVLVLAIGPVLAWLVAVLFLQGADLSAFDRPPGERFGVGRAPSAELGKVLASLREMRERLDRVSWRERIPALRQVFVY